jgi:hypothetical membrane protein
MHHRRRKKRRIRDQAFIGAILWLCTFQFFVASSIAAARAIPHYYWRMNVLSDLGVYQCRPLHMMASFCSPYAVLYNSSLFLQGIFIAGGAYFLRNVLQARAASLVCMVAGCALFVIALDPENANAGLHIAAAVVHCIAANTAIIMFAIALRHSDLIGHRTMLGAMSVGFFGWVNTCMLGLPQLSGSSTGLIERCAVDPLPIMLGAVGLRVLFLKNKIRNS